MATRLQEAITRLRERGYKVEQVPAASVSADGYILLYTVGAGLGSDDDIIRISDGLDHLPTGPDFAPGQAVQLVEPLLPPANVPAGAVATVEAVSPEKITVRKGNKLLHVAPATIRHFPLPEAPKRKR